MNNILWGSVTVFICLIGYYFSWKSFKINKIFLSIFLLMVCGLLLRVFTSLDFYIHTWDECLHSLVAKNFINHPLTPTLYDNPVLPYDISNWGGNHIWLHKQPFPLWTIAGSLYIFGVNEISVRLPSILLTTLGIALTYSIGKNLFNKKIGYLSAFLYSINGLIIEITSGRIPTDHIDAFFLFFVQLSIFFAIKYAKDGNVFYNILCGLSVGIAIMCKWLPALITLPIWMLLIINYKKLPVKKIILNFLLLIFIIAITFLPWQININTFFPAEAQIENSLNLRHITEILDNQSGPFYYHFEELRINYGELIYIPVIWFLWKTIKHYKNKRILAVSVWFLLPYIFFSLIQTKMKGYTLLAAPSVFIVTAVFFHYLYRNRNKIKYKLLINVFLILLIFLPVRFCFERIKPFSNLNRTPKWAIDVKNLKSQNFEKNTILFNTRHPLETMFYTGITAYIKTPGIDTLNQLMSKGYKILINNKEELPLELRNLEKINYVNLSNE